ncbi:MAG: DegT/DnrJ/EryC1/StrS family aminotransferase [Flavobacterium sp.]
MTDNKIWLSSPHMGGTELNYIHHAFECNWVAPLGANVDGFEQDLQNYLHHNSKVAVLNSGTAALHLGLILLGVQRGDEVICQTLTFSASVNPVIYLGAFPIFVDSELQTGNICPVSLEKAIVDRIQKGKKPKAIITVHLYGMPFLIEEVCAVAAKYDIPILEDSAEALGSSYKGQMCGTFGEIGVLSFNGNKIITTSGGGALVTQSDAIKKKAIFLATQARDEAPHYQHSEIGYNYRMSNISAGIGRGQMEVINERILLRRKMHEFYDRLLSSMPGVSLIKEPNSDYFSNFWLSTLLIDPTIQNKTSKELRFAFEKDNIESRPFWKPMHLQPVFAQYPYYGDRVAETLFEQGLCLPSGSNLTDNDRQRIENVLIEFFK